MGNHGNTGRKQSPEHVAKRVESIHKTREAWSEEKRSAISEKIAHCRRGQEPWNKGKKCPQYSGENHWNWGNKMPQESIEKMRKSLTGKKQSEETIKRRFASRFGYSHSEETKAKIGLANSGENNGMWEGGISHQEYPAEFWRKNFKEMIRDRDNRKCQICGINENGRRLDIHHIDYNKMNTDPDNLISLCHKCHGKTNFNRDEWQEFFKKQNNVPLTGTNN